MPDGQALQTHMVAENNRLASRSVWDGTIAGTGRAADFTTLDFFRVEDGLIVEHWESVDWVRAYQAFEGGRATDPRGRVRPRQGRRPGRRRTHRGTRRRPAPARLQRRGRRPRPGTSCCVIFGILGSS
ncbi:ester cyclase [Kitasatospora acidiphila]|uniref:ester cyclase n=1 Tax=Kitasatospora acidiphila TaxID=2567942 RepID=UPI003C71CC62